MAIYSREPTPRIGAQPSLVKGTYCMYLHEFILLMHVHVQCMYSQLYPFKSARLL